MNKSKYFKKKKILVTGGDGFIGRALVSSLRRLGARVDSYDLGDGRDICDRERLLKYCRGRKYDLLYHLAAISYVPFSWQEPGKTYQTNLIGTLNALELCRLNKIGKIVFMSSYVYGKPRYLPVDEKHPVAPFNPYAWSKYIGEKLCEAYAGDFGLNCVVLRPFNVYGAGQREKFLIPKLVAQVIRGRVVMVNDRKPKRDWLYLDDMVEALLLAGRKKTKGLKVLNLGYGRSYSVGEAAVLAGQAAGKKIVIRDLGKKRKAEVQDVVADVRLATSRLGWRPKIALAEGLREIISRQNTREK